MSVKNWYVNKGIRSEIEVLAIGGEGVITSVLNFKFGFNIVILLNAQIFTEILFLGFPRLYDMHD